MHGFPAPTSASFIRAGGARLTTLVSALTSAGCAGLSEQPRTGFDLALEDTRRAGLKLYHEVYRVERALFEGKHPAETAVMN